MVLVGKHEEKIPLGRPRIRWEDNIKMYHREIVLVRVHMHACLWTGEGPVAGSCEHGNEPSGSPNFALWYIISWNE
jgi:hypothetical protein